MSKLDLSKLFGLPDRASERRQTERKLGWKEKCGARDCTNVPTVWFRIHPYDTEEQACEECFERYCHAGTTWYGATVIRRRRV
jgi:hypothetical protein